MSTAIVYRQVRFTLDDTLRIPTKQVVIAEGACGDAIKAEIGALPGIDAAACSAMGSVQDTRVMGRDGTDLAFIQTRIDFGFLELYGLRPLAGRFFSAAYGADHVSSEAPPSFRPNVVINMSALTSLGFSKPADAIGQSVFWIRGMPDAGQRPLPSTIIGVVEDFSFDGPRTKIKPQIYYVAPLPWMSLSMRLEGQAIPETLAALKRILKNQEGARPLSLVFLDQMLQQQMIEVIRQAMCFGIFAGLALFLSCIGLFGLAAFTAEQRTKEIGIRKAMGAGTSEVMRLLVWQFTKPVLWANLIAWPVAGFFINRWLQGFAYHIDLSPWLFLAATALALFISLLTVSVHCYLVAREKPVRALRYE